MHVELDNFITDAVISSLTVDILSTRLDEIRSSGAPPCPGSTVGGYHTDNLVNDPVVSPFVSELLAAFPNGNSLFTCHWIHMIEYDEGGWAKQHNHIATEKYSFILYLNTNIAQGKTVFFLDNNQVLSVCPQKGKIIFFPSRLEHLGEPTVGSKKVLVGALNLHQ